MLAQMNDAAVNAYHAHQAKLQSLGEHWHELIWYGHGDWTGDRFVNLYHHVLTDEIEVRYEIPNQKSELVMKMPYADFDIYKLCRSLAAADNRRSSAKEKLARVDQHNDKLEADQQRVAAEYQDEAVEKIQWGMRKDTGQHIAPMTVPSAKLPNHETPVPTPKG